MVRFVEIQLLEILFENHNGVSNEEMREVSCQAVIHAAFQQLRLDFRIEDQIGIKILCPQPRVI
jgi:hypothetical protein